MAVRNYDLYIIPFTNIPASLRNEQLILVTAGTILLFDGV